MVYGIADEDFARPASMKTAAQAGASPVRLWHAIAAGELIGHDEALRLT